MEHRSTFQEIRTKVGQRFELWDSTGTYSLARTHMCRTCTVERHGPLIWADHDNLSLLNSSPVSSGCPFAGDNDKTDIWKKCLWLLLKNSVLLRGKHTKFSVLSETHCFVFNETRDYPDRQQWVNNWKVFLWFPTTWYGTVVHNKNIWWLRELGVLCLPVRTLHLFRSLLFLFFFLTHQ